MNLTVPENILIPLKPQSLTEVHEGGMCKGRDGNTICIWGHVTAIFLNILYIMAYN